jgi:hypothetical protein
MIIIKSIIAKGVKMTIKTYTYFLSKQVADKIAKQIYFANHFWKSEEKNGEIIEITISKTKEGLDTKNENNETVIIPKDMLKKEPNGDFVIALKKITDLKTNEFILYSYILAIHKEVK